MLKNPYVRLSKRSRGLLSTGQLWLADDHLLSIQEVVITQSYRRFYFKDIEGIIIGYTSFGAYYSIIGCLLFLISWLIMVNSGTFENLGSGIIGVSVLVLLGIMTVGNFLQGRICKMQIQTKLGPYKLPIRPRLKNAHHIVKTIMPKVEQAQQSVSNGTAYT